MKQKPPKPMNPQSYLPLIQRLEAKTSDLLTASEAVDRYVDDVWDMEGLSEKELLALHQAFKKQHGSACVIVKVSRR